MGKSMITCRTPYRISFFGGGTDYPAWYHQFGGAVLSTSIDKYCYLTCRNYPPFFGSLYRIVWSHIEQVNSLEEILHPVVPKLLDFMKINTGIELHHIGDLPARSGMGSSSSFIVCLLQALHALNGDLISKKDLLRESIFFEQKILCENVGSQDQTSAVYGGFNKIEFNTDGKIRILPVQTSSARLLELNSHLMLFYTGISRNSTAIAQKYIKQIISKEQLLIRMRKMVDDGLEILCGNNSINDFGLLLDEAWELKRSLDSAISSKICDDVYETAKKSGAVGGKILGAGGGGFMLLFVPPEMQYKVRKSLSHLIHVPFCFEQLGTHIVHQDFDMNQKKIKENMILDSEYHISSTSL